MRERKLVVLSIMYKFMDKLSIHEALCLHMPDFRYYLATSLLLQLTVGDETKLCTFRGK